MRLHTSGVGLGVGRNGLGRGGAVGIREGPIVGVVGMGDGTNDVGVAVGSGLLGEGVAVELGDD